MDCSVRNQVTLPAVFRLHGGAFGSSRREPTSTRTLSTCRMRASLLLRSIARSILLVFVLGCCARRPAHTMVNVASGAVAASLLSDDVTAAAFRVLIDQIIGDSADRVCVSVAEGRTDAPHAILLPK